MDIGSQKETSCLDGSSQPMWPQLQAGLEGPLGGCLGRPEGLSDLQIPAWARDPPSLL